MDSNTYEQLLERVKHLHKELKGRSPYPDGDCTRIAKEVLTKPEYHSMYQLYPVVCHVALYNLFFDPKALQVYFDTYHVEALHTKERYMIVQKSYLENIDRKWYRMNDIQKDTFIQFHLALMESIIDEVTMQASEKKRRTKLQEETNKNLLLQRLGHVAVDST